jgi:ribonucleoside-diphosphate reductase alpha chain
MSLQYGVPLEDYVRKFSHMRFEPQGYTKNPDIRIAKSLIDYIFRWLGITFLPGYKEASMGILKSDSGGEDSSGGSEDGETQSKPVAAGKKPATGGQKKLSDIKPRPPVAESAKPTPNGTASVKPQAKKLTGANGHTNGHANGHTNGHTGGKANGSTPSTEINTALLARAGIMPKDAGPNTARSEQFADFQSDAPACDNCGSITVRAGNCYLCHNCGSSMGCS